VRGSQDESRPEPGRTRLGSGWIPQVEGGVCLDYTQSQPRKFVDHSHLLFICICSSKRTCVLFYNYYARFLFIYLFIYYYFKYSAKEVVLTEGEYDAMAVYQGTGMPAVSLPNGEDFIKFA
jgi:hypothetical protein